MKRLLFSLFLSLVVVSGFSQPINTQVKGAVSNSPEAASLGKFQEHPVDFAHGLVNVNFPIYQINHGPLSLDVALRYHGSGVSVRNVESWCGTGFALEGQYMISRQIQGKEDDGVQGYYVAGNTLDFSNINHRRDIATSSRDGESDIYSYAIPGYSGKFFFNEHQTPQFVPKNDLRIQVIHSSPFFEGFILTDPNGTKYYFGYIDETNKGYVEMTIPDVEEAGIYHSGWYLARIESFDGVYKIDYNYEDNYTYSYDQLSACRIINYTSSGCHPANELNSCQGGTSFVVDIEGKKLQSITCPVATVSFTSDGVRQDVTSGNTLDTITLTTGTFCKEYVLTYDYFEDTPITGPESYRLKLDKLQEQTCAGDTLPAFRFDYYGTSNSGVPFLINRFSRQIDSWGYYNGKANNESTGTINIPSTTVPFLSSSITKGASDRSTDFNFMVQGSLKAIHNRKGGSTHFEYEANSYPGTVTGSETTFFSLASCVDNANGCCLEKQEKEDTTFTSQTFIDDATFDLFLSPSCTNPDENYFDILVKVYEQVNGAFVYRTEIGFNQEVTTQTTTPKQPLSSLYNFQPNVLYNFEITTTDAFGRFQIYNAPQFTDNIDVGGLRIKKVTYKDGIDGANDVSREYFYLKEEGGTLSSGILVKEPIYGYSVQAEHIEGVASDEVAMAIHSEESLIPLSSFQGSHISYSRVEERRTGHGKTVHTYDIVYSGIDKSYPSAPLYYQRNAGQLKTATIQKEDGTPVNQVMITPEDKQYTYGPAFLKSLLIAQLPPCGGLSDPESYYVSSTEYDIRSSLYLVKARETVQDGVTSLNTNTYDPLERHFFPITETLTNSDGTIFSTENSYVFDDSLIYGTHSFTYDSMVVRNQISTPIQVVEKANGIITKGTRTGFNSFNPTTGGPGAPSNFNAYPYQFSNYEMTWDENGTIVDDGWIVDGTINTYDPLTGQPNQFNKVGWKTELYTWHPINGLNTSRTFEGFNWRKEYYPNTRLIQTEVEIDSQKIHYEYDSFIRLNKIRSRNDQVVVDMDYEFLEGGNALNYINQKTTYAADPTGNSALAEIQTRQYFGGQGRLLQNIQIGHSPNGKDVIETFDYDNQGQLVRAYEPFESIHSTGQYAADTSGIPHTLVEYEASPLNREIQMTAPAWHPTETEYGANSAADAVINYQTGGTYTIGSLFKSTAIDGNNNQKIAFSDIRGKVILERTQSADGLQKNDLYRKYDLKEREIAIYPPGTTPDSTELIYTKRYDVADNLVEKKVPDAAKMDYAYDVRDLQIGMQNGNLRADGKWIVTEFDDYGRNIKRGLNSTPTTVNEIWTKTFWDGEVEAGNSLVGFYDLEIPKEFKDVIDESEASLVPPDNSANPIYIGKTHYTETAILMGNTASINRLISFNRYDTYGRVDRIQVDNHLGGFDNSLLSYDFADNLVREIRFHAQSDNMSDFTTQTRNYFDAQGRKIRDNHLITGIGVFSNELCSLAYDVKDQLITKKLGGISGGGFLQEVNYTYLPNGFLAGINPTMSADDLFGFNINYDQNVAGLSGTGQKNGNITSLSWQVKGSAAKTYGFHYDYLNRLTVANHNSPMNDYGTTYGYDARGNFTSITRRGMYSDGSSYTSQQMDNMAFMPHAGTNKVKTITDAAPCPDNKVIHQALDNTEIHAVEETILADNTVNETGAITYQAGTSITLEAGFHAKAGTNFVAKIADCPQGNYETAGFVQRSTNDYLYDDNGNQTRDPNKGITKQYNYLSLPYQITFDNGNIIEWLYLGNGTKVQKTVKRDGVATPILKQDYFSSFEYQNDTLDAIYLENAKVVFDKGDFEAYQFYLHDNVNNNRLVFKDNGSGVAEIVNESHYYPNGGLMAGAWQESSRAKYLYNGIESVNDFGLNVYHARFRTLDPWTNSWWQIDPEVERFSAWSPYNQNLGNSVRLSDPDGDCPTCITGFIGLVGGAVIGGGIEIASQLYNEGTVSDWKAVGGSALQGGITGGAAGLTGGASLATTAAVAGTANVAGGIANRNIQGQETTAGDIVADAAIGAGFAAAGQAVGNIVKNTTNNLSRSAKGKLGEALTEAKYAARGYKSRGKAIVRTGRKTPTGRNQRAIYDHNMDNLVTGQRITVESKFNTSGLTSNQRVAQSRVTTPGGLIVDRITSGGLGNTTKAVITGSSGTVSEKIKN